MKRIIFFGLSLILVILVITILVNNLNQQSMDQAKNYKIFSETDDLPMNIGDSQRFTPSDQEAKKGLEILENYLKNNSTVRDFSEYRIRFFGYINSAGEKNLWADGFCQEFKGDWEDSSVGVEGGGNCFFQIKVNLDKPEVSDLQINSIF